MAALLVLGALGIAQQAATAAAQEDVAALGPRVFRMLLAGADPFTPLSPFENFSDVAALSDGRIVALPDCCGSKWLFELDVMGRARRLRVDQQFEASELNSVIEAPDGALLFSERGRVLRRAPDGTTSVVAGTSRERRASGDGGPAVGAGMWPTGLALLADGSLLIADARSNRVRRVNPAGQITTVAGTGVRGSDGDGGPAVNARMTNPVALSAGADGSYLIAHGAQQMRVRRVATDGTISTVAGGGAVGAEEDDPEPCPRSAVPATSLYFSADGFGDIAGLADGGFLLTTGAGLLRVSPLGSLVGVMCSPFGPNYRPDGRDIYVAGRPLSSAFLANNWGADVAVAADGSMVIDDGGGETAVLVVETPGESQRLAVALAPETLAAVHQRRVVVASTMAAHVEVGVYRRRQRLAHATGELQAGETTLGLPRRLGPGVHNIKLLARTADGRLATHSLRVLGTPTVPMRLAKRIFRDYFYDSEVGEGDGYVRLSPCRHPSRRRVWCRARGQLIGEPFRTTYGLRLRRNGVLVLLRRYGNQRRAYATAVNLEHLR
jgi:hypothetical protein